MGAAIDLQGCGDGNWVTAGEGGADGAVEDSVQHEDHDIYFLGMGNSQLAFPDR